MKKYSLKPLFAERMKALLGEDFENYQKILEKEPAKSIRVNTLKISPEKLKLRLEKKGWKLNQPWENYPEVMIIEGKFVSDKNKINDNEQSAENNVSNNVNKINPQKSYLLKSIKAQSTSDSEHNLVNLSPGELGRSLEHLLGYYYIQELASMLPVIALQPKPDEIILDLCAAPGSKTTQLAAKMQNTGTIIANEINLGRLIILASNLERCGATNTLITRKDGRALCEKLREEENPRFDKILLDAPCSGEGTLRSTPATYLMWNIKTIKSLSRIQKQLFKSAFEILKVGGEIIYSTCTHAPEENEEVVDFVLQKFGDKIKIEQINLPITCRAGLKGWVGEVYSKETTKSCRIYPQDNDTEGFFIAKFRRIK